MGYPVPKRFLHVPSHRPISLDVTDPRQWAVCSKPLRLEIIDALRTHAPCSIADIARDLGRPAPTLYRHIEALENAGFVTRPGFRKNGRHVEQLVDLAADNFRIAFKTKGKAEHTAIVSTTRAFMRAGYATVKNAAASGSLRITPDDLNVMVAYGLGRLSPDAFKQVRTLIGQVRDIMTKGREAGPERGGDLYAITFVVSPVTPGTPRRKPSRSPARASARRSK